MKNLFYKLFCVLFLTPGGTILYAMLTFIAGLVGAGESPTWMMIIFIGVVWMGGFALWSAGMTNRWRMRYMNSKNIEKP